ncbi:MAG: DUF4388 domain-containing protein, partial [Blastochloris sp.]|nr:DUF4388 domain-containing protein [Blastochloris sp.]
VTHNPRVSIIVMSALATLEDFKNRPPITETVHYLAKPFMFRDLTQVLQRVLESEPESVIQGFRPISLLQIVQLESKTCRIDLDDGESKGMLIFKDGELLRAELGEMEGEEALLALLAFESPTFKVFPAPPRYVFNIERPLPELLLKFATKKMRKFC